MNNLVNQGVKCFSLGFLADEFVFFRDFNIEFGAGRVGFESYKFFEGRPDEFAKLGVVKRQALVPDESILGQHEGSSGSDEGLEGEMEDLREVILLVQRNVLNFGEVLELGLGGSDREGEGTRGGDQKLPDVLLQKSVNLEEVESGDEHRSEVQRENLGSAGDHGHEVRPGKIVMSAEVGEDLEEVVSAFEEEPAML